MLPVPAGSTTVPQLPDPFVPRARLLTALDDERSRTMLVCAPAGFGRLCCWCTGPAQPPPPSRLPGQISPPLPITCGRRSSRPSSPAPRCPGTARRTSSPAARRRHRPRRSPPTSWPHLMLCLGRLRWSCTTSTRSLRRRRGPPSRRSSPHVQQECASYCAAAGTPLPLWGMRSAVALSLALATALERIALDQGLAAKDLVEVWFAE
jgi:hypothetical protein